MKCAPNNHLESINLIAEKLLKECFSTESIKPTYRPLTIYIWKNIRLEREVRGWYFIKSHSINQDVREMSIISKSRHYFRIIVVDCRPIDLISEFWKGLPISKPIWSLFESIFINPYDFNRITRNSRWMKIEVFLNLSYQERMARVQ